MKVKCKLCGEEIRLNKDSMEAREKGEDPYRQMRAHLAGHLPVAVAMAVMKLGWLIDALMFQAADPKEQFEWQEKIQMLAGHFAADPLKEAKK